jgi:L-alanine-DL-glutamate epimerase-like enolase superfamily enzyme
LKRSSRSDAALDAVVIKVSTDEGLTGIGEVNAVPAVVRAAVNAGSYHSWSMGFRDLLIGEDPEHTERLWDKMYHHTGMSGRRGLVPNLIAGIDVALWDIRGKAAGKPIHHLLGGARREQIDAYLTVDPDPGPDPQKVLAQTLSMVEQGLKLGLPRVKIETSLEQVRDEAWVPRFVAETRRLVGPDAALMLDVVYRWHDVKTALRTLERMADSDLYFVEAPFSNDHLDSYAELARRSPVRVAAGEWLITRFEFLELMDRGACDVVQPGICRVGGFTEAMRVARLAADRGRLIVPYGWWATGIGLASSLQFAFAVEPCPFVEYVHPLLYPSVLREHLVGPAFVPVDGRFALPTAPGLGVALDDDIVKRYRVNG